MRNQSRKSVKKKPEDCWAECSERERGPWRKGGPDCLGDIIECVEKMEKLVIEHRAECKHINFRRSKYL